MNKKSSENNSAKSTESKPASEADKLKLTISELTDTLQRLQADFENYRKRVDKEKAQVAATTKAAVIQQLLPIIDAFEIASKSSEDSHLKKGIALIQLELSKVMAHLEMKPIVAVGHKCDPHKHEVLMQEEREDCDDDMITEELQKGYTIGNYVIRTSKVKVAKKSKDEKKEQKGKNENSNGKNTQEHSAQ